MHVFHHVALHLEKREICHLKFSNSKLLKIINSRNYETSCNILDKHRMLLVKKAYENAQVVTYVLCTSSEMENINEYPEKKGAATVLCSTVKN